MLLQVAAIVALLSAQTAIAKADGYRRYSVGKLSGHAPDDVSGGLLLIGGGERNFDALKWFFAKAGHGHIVILRASQAGEIGQEFYNGVGGILSAETFVFSSRAAASDRRVLERIRRADGIFIAGGNQSRYVRFWKGTAVARLLDAHVAAGKPLAGTSAGLAILGEQLYGAMNGGSITSPRALANPFGPANTIESNFLHLNLMKGVVTDTHFKERDRLGRLFAFVAKAQADRPSALPPLIGLGVDESAALAVEPDGTGRIYATAADCGVWLVDGAGLRDVARKGPLDVGRVRVTRVVGASLVHLPSGTVEHPSVIQDYAVRTGQMVELDDVSPATGSAFSAHDDGASDDLNTHTVG